MKALVANRQKAAEGEDEALKALIEQAGEVGKGLEELEKRFRTPPKTKGVVFDDHRVLNQVFMARYYVGSSNDAPTSTARVYVEHARQSLEEAETDLDRFLSTDLADFSRAVADAGIGLFMR